MVNKPHTVRKIFVLKSVFVINIYFRRLVALFLLILKCYNNISMKKFTITFMLIIILTMIFLPLSCVAQPYGKGLYDEDVPYGTQTSLSIAVNGNVGIPIIPTDSGVLADGSSTITVTSTDVKGYKLYIRALSDTNLNNSGAVLPASSNGLPAPLSINTWGYNTDASDNYLGITLSDSLIKSVTSPVKNGDITNVKYGIYMNLSKPAGNYTTTVIYTAVPQTD